MPTNVRFYNSGNHLKTNWGDYLNIPLFDYLTDETISFNPVNIQQSHILGIGSILKMSNRFSTVWGSGFINQNSILSEAPKKVLSVRGPLSRNKLLEQNIDCPEVYGDPALLTPLIYQPKKEKKYSWGIIPHYIDKNSSAIKSFAKKENVLIIDILSPTFDFIDQVSMCEKIASSSLHGLIAADAYRIPSLWVEFSSKVLGNGFKFQDYFASVGRHQESAIFCDENTILKKHINSWSDGKIYFDPTQLIESCPLTIKKIRRQEFIQRLKSNYDHGN